MKMGTLCALHFECAKNLTAQPKIAVYDCRGETIFDMPYSRLIFTPGRYIKKRDGT